MYTYVFFIYIYTFIHLQLPYRQPLKYEINYLIRLGLKKKKKKKIFSFFFNMIISVKSGYFNECKKVRFPDR
jgi:hypothetical protein